MAANKIECAPFVQPWEKIGKIATSDSVVGWVSSPKSNDPYVIKWNRLPIEGQGNAVRASMFLKKSIDLYKEVLGSEFIVPTSIAVGSKMDGSKLKPKVFIFQPKVDGWTGQSIPDEMRNDEFIKYQWKTLYGRLQVLYITARSINKPLPQDSPEIFPINLCVGDSRKLAIQNQQSENLPNTPNILIDSNLHLKLCDFGPYSLWNPQMEPTYQEIRKTAKELLLRRVA